MKTELKEPTWDSLKSVDPKLRSRAFSAFTDVLKNSFPQQYEDYKKGTDKMKRDHMARFLLSPESGGCMGTNETTREVKNLDSSEIQWFTLQTLSGPNHFNDMDMAKDAIKDMESRPIVGYPTLAAQGVKEYRRVTTKETDVNIKSSKASVTAKADISPDDFAAIERDMASSTAASSHAPPPAEVPKGKRRQVSKTTPAAAVVPIDSGAPPPPNPEKEKRVAALTKLGNSIKSQKSQYDKMMKDLSTISMVEDSLKEKTWMSSALTWLQTKTKEQEAAAAVLFEGWKNNTKVHVPTLSTDEILETSTRIDNETKTSAESYDDYRKNVVGEFVKRNR